MTEIEALILVLERSIGRHGEQPLTNVWLCNILKMALRTLDEEEQLANYAGFDPVHDRG